MSHRHSLESTLSSLSVSRGMNPCSGHGDCNLLGLACPRTMESQAEPRLLQRAGNKAVEQRAKRRKSYKIRNLGAEMARNTGVLLDGVHQIISNSMAARFAPSARTVRGDRPDVAKCRPSKKVSHGERFHGLRCEALKIPWQVPHFS
jgi:hypothetical protein